MKTIKCERCNKEYPKDTKFCSECGKHLKKDNIFSFFIAILFLYFAVEIVTIFLPNIIVSSISYHKYGQDFLYESLMALVILIVMLLSRNSYVFTQKREKFKKSLLLGWPFLVLAFITLFQTILTLEDFNFFSCLNLVMYCLTIGIYEEFLCRGWIQNEFLERFGGSKKLVIRSIILASFIFGAIHFFNLLAGQSLFETVMQVIHATACGFFLGTLYYRTKNIWCVILLHAFWDFSLFLSEHTLIRECTTGIATKGIVIDNIVFLSLLSLFYVVVSILLLKGCNFEETIISLNNEPNSDIENKTSLKEKINKFISSFKEDKSKIILYGLLIVLMVIVNLPISFASESEYEKYSTCYNYETKKIGAHEIHEFFRYEYEIKHSIETTIKNEIVTDQLNPDGTPVVNLETIKQAEEFDFLIYLDEDDDYNSIIKNNVTGDKLVLDNHFKDIAEVVVIENKDSYTIAIHSTDYLISTIYYVKLNKADFKNTKEYLENIVKEFKQYDLPLLSKVGYIQEVKSDYKNLYMMSDLKDEFFIDESGNLYLLNYVN